MRGADPAYLAADVDGPQRAEPPRPRLDAQPARQLAARGARRRLEHGVRAHRAAHLPASTALSFYCSRQNSPAKHCNWNTVTHTHTHTHTHTFNGPFSGTTLVSRYQKGEIWILLKLETVSGSGISWTICKSAPRSRQITTPAPHHSLFYRPDALSAAQPKASRH